MRPESPRAVVIRRGPASVHCTIGWELDGDRFAVGQWCKHKLYPRRSDISPDGVWLVYFALNGRWTSETRGAWTGLSRAPYLKAVKMWPQGDTWDGGGVFFRARSQLPDGLGAMWDSMEPVGRTGRLALGALASYEARLERDGWSRRVRRGYFKDAHPSWSLRKVVRGEAHEHHEIHRTDGTVAELPAWEWADIDAARARVVWAEAGTVRAAPIRAGGPGKPRVLFDAAPMRFEALAAPYV
jgi:hypothetical protein